MQNEQLIHSKGRGSQIAPPNRFEQVHAEAELPDWVTAKLIAEAISACQTL